MGRTPISIVLAAAAAAGVLATRTTPPLNQEEGRLLDGALHHLGDDVTPKWSEAPAQPEGTSFELAFESRANAREWLLEATQRSVDTDWTLALNGRAIATLRRTPDELQTFRYEIPAGTLVDGRNVLTIRGAHPGDDILFGRLRLHEKSLRELLHLGRVVVHVADATTQEPLPARVTVTDAGGRKLELYYAEAPTTAIRPGIAYTCNGTVALEVPAGRCEVWATRGMEWSMARVPVEVAADRPQDVSLFLRREVDTTGWIAADTHIHTMTYSGHGDASIEERIVTIPGEGIEMPVATDHNHHTDYRPLQRALHLERWFTPVTGNEVTTDNGHMNAFPLSPDVPVPATDLTDWSRLVEGIRARGAKVVILNHPRWPGKGKDPLTRFGFDELTGGNRDGQRFTFDCLELVNSDCTVQPTESTLRVWYGLLNRGLRFPGVGASDSHHVGVIVGQGRTYVPSATDDPAQIDVDAACRAFKEGRVSVSHGLFATIVADGRAGMGDTLRVTGREVSAVVTVRHPSWVKPVRLDLVLDGKVAASADLAARAPDDRPTAETRRLSVPVAGHDQWLVAVAWGEPVTAPCWATELENTCAITNPIWLDVDGDGRCSSPRDLARACVERAGGAAGATARLPALAAQMAQVDDAVAYQLLDLLREAPASLTGPALETVAAGAGTERAAALDAWIARAAARPER